MDELKENEIVCPSQRVKYNRVEYGDGFVIIEQNRTRRRVPAGYYFDDDGQYIYVSTFYSHIFQHKEKVKRFVLNKETKEWREWQDVIVEKHWPEQMNPIEKNEIEILKK